MTLTRGSLSGGASHTCTQGRLRSSGGPLHGGPPLPGAGRSVAVEERATSTTTTTPTVTATDDLHAHTYGYSYCYRGVPTVLQGSREKRTARFPRNQQPSGAELT